MPQEVAWTRDTGHPTVHCTGVIPAPLRIAGHCGDLVQLRIHILSLAVIGAKIFTLRFRHCPLHPVHAVEPDVAVRVVALLPMVNPVLLVNHRRYCWSTWSPPSP